MSRKIYLFVFVCLFLVASNAYAAKLDVYIDGVDTLPEGIWASQIGFDITGDWNFISSLTGQNTSTINWPLAGMNMETPYSVLFMDIPGVGKIFQDKWAKAANQPTPGRIVIALNDSDFGVNYLGNGLLFSLIYPDTVSLKLDIGFIEFVTTGGGLADLSASAQTFGSGNNTLIFSPVPIPSSLLLLGGGIFALVGITRRKK